jgi:lipoprotein-anchoring transpeptidase ErfK/SrfK
MPVPRPRGGRRTVGVWTATVLVAAAALAGCSATADSGFSDNTSDQPTPDKQVSQAQLKVNVPKHGPVSVDKLVHVTVHDGTLRNVRFAAGKQKVPGQLAHDQASWTASQRLEPGTTYHLSGTAVDADGLSKKISRSFRTIKLSLDQQTYPSIAPLGGDTVGVGMPIILRFDVPVTNKASIERNLSVETHPAQQGTWHWISDNEVHWRPKTYWKPGTDVTVHADVNGVNAGNGIYGQENRTSSFHIGDAVFMKISIANHEMRVLRNGHLLRTIPITAGQPGLETRSGVKVIIEKFRYKDMDAATTGVSPGDPNYYNISNVEYAQRVTYSGEFLHAAPWSLGYQGSANVSHGCVGMSTENAAWLFGLTHVGDVVDVTGSSRHMEPTNGYGDWNVSWKDYKAGSALS